MFLKFISSDQLRRFSTVLLISTIIIGAVGRTYYYIRHTQQENLYLDASHAYEEFCRLQKKVSSEQSKKTAQFLIKNYSKTPYAQLVRLKVAQAAVQQNQLQEAAQYLSAIMTQTKDPDLYMIAKKRRARVLMAMGKLDAALQLIDHPDAQSYTTAIEEIKGDIFLALGQKEKAIDSYYTAKHALPDVEKLQPLLQMKLDDLGNIKEALPSL